ncbi:MAG: SDR family oxidoreductase [Candidatus Limnocylindrales bacterium]|jgi:nucleoside-diphosphate-sugar epimerase
MKVLFVGGTGLISGACTSLAVERGLDLFLLNRGHNPDRARGASVILADLHDEAAVGRALAGSRFDVVVDWIAFTPEDIERDLRLFGDRTDQFVFISSASAYQKPLGDWLIREDTPLANRFWDYSRNKIACEERLTRAYREDGFPVTIVRPSLTYGDTQVPLVVNSWERPYTAIARMRRGEPLIVPGDGTSLWTITHNSDFARGFVGLLGRRSAIGHAFNITSDEVLTWDEIYRQTAAAAGVEAQIVHIASDFIAACLPEMTGTLLGDKSNSAVFDTTKIKRFVPDFHARTPFAEGIRRTIAWFDADPARKQVDAQVEARWDRLIAAYERGLAKAMKEFASGD